MKYFLTLILLFLFSSFRPHPIHLAVTEIVFKNKSAQVVHKIFIDDLEKHIEKNEKKKGKDVKLNLNTDKQSLESEALIQKYLRENFNIKINNKVFAPKYLGSEFETDAIWVYEEIENVGEPGKIEIFNKILLEFYNDQTDFVHVKVNDKKQSARFEKGHTLQAFNF